VKINAAYGRPVSGYLFGRQREGDRFMLEMAFMGGVAERLVIRASAPADGNGGSPTQVVYITVLIHYLKIAFYF